MRLPIFKDDDGNGDNDGNDDNGDTMICKSSDVASTPRPTQRRGQAAFFSRGASSPVLLGDVGRESRSGFMFILDMLNQHC